MEILMKAFSLADLGLLQMAGYGLLFALYMAALALTVVLCAGPVMSDIWRLMRADAHPRPEPQPRPFIYSAVTASGWPEGMLIHRLSRARQEPEHTTPET
jgi:hypothetical protein